LWKGIGLFSNIIAPICILSSSRGNFASLLLRARLWERWLLLRLRRVKSNKLWGFYDMAGVFFRTGPFYGMINCLDGFVCRRFKTLTSMRNDRRFGRVPIAIIDCLGLTHCFILAGGLGIPKTGALSCGGACFG
jgi:hypothetical protein